MFIPIPLTDAVNWLLRWRNLLAYIYEKRGVCPVTRSTPWRPSHCLDCRNEQRRKPHASVNIQFALSATKRQNRPKPIRLYRIHLIRRSRCFVFDNQLEVAKFLRRQNQSVQLRLFMYTCPPNLCPSGFRHGFRRYKVSTISSKTALFDSPKISLIPDLILLTINMSRSSTFFLVIIVE